MATKELAFNSKIRNLKEYLQQVMNFSQPPPPGSDVANTVKYFNQILLTILKDAPNIQGEEFYGAKFAQTNIRLAMFPTLNYLGLYDVLCQFLPVVQLISIGQEALVESLLQLVSCLSPFIPWDRLTSLPFSVTLMLPIVPQTLHAEIIRILCTNLLPNTLGHDVDNNENTTESVAGMLMLVLQHCRDARLHTRFLECLLPLKENLYKDLVAVMAYGPPNTVIPATRLLFYYWPQLNSLIGQTVLPDTYVVLPWQPTHCQRLSCINKLERPAASKLCTHPGMCVTESNMPPPTSICVDCFDTAVMRKYDAAFTDLVMPADHISTTCNNKNCLNPSSKAVALCCSIECVKMNRFRPVSLCQTCHSNRHPGKCGYVQTSIPNIWTLDQETQSYFVDGIVNLLREAEIPIATGPEDSMAVMDSDPFSHARNPIDSRFGILLLKELCKPHAVLSVEALGRLLGMLFRWFQCTGSSSNPTTSNMLEKLKTEFMTEWLQEVKRSHYEVILSTLLPHPPEFSKVGGQWERLSSRSEQIREGLEKLITLGPYDIVTYEVWDYIMPYWLESVRTEVNLKERDEVRTLLRQTFDIEMSPLPFLLDKMYHFIDERFQIADPKVQEQGLQWLQILTSVDIAIPFITLLKMFKEGVRTLRHGPVATHLSEPTMLDVKLNCCIFMLDILLKQSELSRMPPHAGVTQNKSKDMFILVTDMILCVKAISCVTNCQIARADCKGCHNLIVFYQLACNLLRNICPQLEVTLPVVDLSKLAERQASVVESTAGPSDVQEIPAIHHLFMTLLQEMENDFDTDRCFYIAQCLKHLYVHGSCLQLLFKTHPALVNTCLHQEFIPRCWKLLRAKDSRSGKLIITMLLHAIALGEGHTYFWQLVNGDFAHSSWTVRYAAAEKCRLFWEFTNPDTLVKNQIVITSLAHMFCHYVTLLHDANQSVAQRATLQLDLISDTGLQVITFCLSVQFDVVVSDRQLILHKLVQLQNAMPTRVVLSWKFFLARLQQLFLEAEICGDPSDPKVIRDLSHQLMQSRGSLAKLTSGQNLDHMIKVATFASSRMDSIPSIKDQSFVNNKTCVSLPPVAKDKDKRFATAASSLLRQKGKSKKGSSLNDDSSIVEQPVAHPVAHPDDEEIFYSYVRYVLYRDEVMSELVSADGKIIMTLLKALDRERLDASVMHLLLSSLMKFMASKMASNDDAETQHQRQSVIDHMFHLLGYSDGKFYVQPAKLRVSPILQAILGYLAKFLDANIVLGQKMLRDCLNLLKFCSSPQKYASDTQAPDYSLVTLSESLRKPWIQALLVILYKYDTSAGEISTAVKYLVRVVLNTLSAARHVCKEPLSDTESIDNVAGVIQRGLSESSDLSSDAEADANNKNDAAKNSLCGATSVIHEEHELDTALSDTLPSSNQTGVSPRRRFARPKLHRQPSVDLQSPEGGSETGHTNTLARDPREVLDLLHPSEYPSQSRMLPLQDTGSEEKTPILHNSKKPSTADIDKRMIIRKSDSGESAGSLAEKDKKFGNRFSKVKKQKSKSDLLEVRSGSHEDDTSAMLQSAAAASDFMARSKRAPLFTKSFEASMPGGSLHTLQGQSSIQLATTPNHKSCHECGAHLEEYTEEIIVNSIVVIESYLNRDISQAACMVYEMLESASRLAKSRPYSWQNSDRTPFIPGNMASAAQQFLRCCLHQLHSYNVMAELFLSANDSSMLTTIAKALTDFPELSSQQALLSALEGVNGKETLPKPLQLVHNADCYLRALTVDLSTAQEWPKIVDQLEILFRKLIVSLPSSPTDLSDILNLMTTILKLPVVNNTRYLLDTYAKMMVVILQRHTFSMAILAKLCQLCYKTFTKDRERLVMARAIVNELIQVLKYKIVLPEQNILIILEILCMDCGSTLLPTYITSEIPSQLTSDMIIETGIMDVVRLHLTDFMEFVSDLHSLTKLKAHLKSNSMHEDTFGGLLKTGISQIVALEFSKMIQLDPKANQRIIPWLYNQPNTIQRGPREFIDSVDHLRFLCWLYLGTLTHQSIVEDVLSTKCQPLLLDDAHNISIIVMSILTGFAEYSASSVEYMSSLFYAFILCQVWTMYCETLTHDDIEREPEDDIDITQIIYDFWAKVTPTILNLMSNSRVLAEMVNLHVLSMMETLQECHSVVLLKLFSLWKPLLYSVHKKLPTNVQVRLQTIENWNPPEKKLFKKVMLFEWVKKVQFKLAQIEVQSSTALKFLAI